MVPAAAHDKLAGKLAQDEYTESLYGWAGNQINSLIEEGLAFLGYPILAEMAQRAEYRIFSEIIAEDMTRRWIDMKGAGNKGKEDKVKRFADVVAKYELPQLFRTVAEYDGLFGRGHIYPDLKTPSGKRVYDDKDELKTPIGTGRDATSKVKVTRGSLVGFRAMEATWIYPGIYNSADPLREDWYRPENWYVMSKTVHYTRLLTVIGRPVPDILKPAYSFGGLSMSQMAKPYVDNWLQTRQAVNDIIHSFSVFGLKTNLMVLLASGGHKLGERAETFNTLRDNGNMMVIDKETEDFFNVSAPLGGLHELQSQAQEHMFSVGRIPGVKFAGIQPSGLNACLVGDTLIETDDGYIPIKDVKPGYKVMTRSGFALVAKAGCTGYATELVEIVSGKATLRCTANHPIWLPSINAFVNAGSVKIGDCLLLRPRGGREDHIKLLRTASCGGATGIVSLRKATTRIGGRVADYIEQFGRYTKDLFQKTLMCITRMVTASTTSSVIWSFSGTENTHSITYVERFELARASFVKRNLKQITQGRPFIAVTDAVLVPINVVRVRATTTKAISQTVSSVVSLLWSLVSVIRGHGIAAQSAPAKDETVAVESVVVSSVRRVPASEYVYDIQVAPGYLPEFFANGICVHNSSEGEIRVYYDTIKGRQERLFRKPLTTCLDWIQLSEFGEVDEELTFDFVNLWELDQAASAAVQQQKAATHAIYVNDIGAVSPEEVRQSVAADPDSPYGGLDIGDTPPPEPPMPEEMGGGAAAGGKPKAPTTNPLSERLERQAEEFGSPESGGFSAKDEEDEALKTTRPYSDFFARG